MSPVDDAACYSRFCARIGWATHDSTDYVSWENARRVTLPQLKPSLQTISIRLPQAMIEALKTLANKRDVPYQSLLKVFLAERIDQEFRSRA